MSWKKKPADSVVVQEGMLASFFGLRRHLMRTDISLMLAQCIRGGNKDVRNPIHCGGFWNINTLYSRSFRLLLESRPGLLLTTQKKHAPLGTLNSCDSAVLIHIEESTPMKATQCKRRGADDDIAYRALRSDE